MRHHASAETLALYREGALSARKAAGIASHLSGCSRCAGIIRDLANVSAVLTATQLPPMPDVLVVRIQAAIASESVMRAASSPDYAARTQAAGAPAASGVGAGAPGAGTAGSAGAAGAAGAGGVAGRGAGEDGAAGREHIPGRPDLPERAGRGARRFRMPRLSSPVLLRALAATAAVVVVAGGGFLLASGQTASESSGGGSSGSSGRPASAPRPAVSNAHAAQQRSAPRAPAYVNYRLKGKVAATNAIASHTNFTSATLASQVRREVASSSVLVGGFAGPQHGARPEPANSRVGGVSISRLEGCLNRVTAGRKVLLADVARYLGSPATIIVFKSLTADVFDVTIVGLSCSASNSDVISRTTVPVS